MSNITLTQLEDAISTAVDTQCGIGNGGYIQTIDSFDGKYDTAFEELTVRLPCVLIEIEGFKPKAIAARGTAVLVTRDEITINLILGASNLKSKKEAKRGTHGIYDIAEDVRTALEGMQLGLAITALDLTDFFRIDHELPGVRLYQMVFSTTRKFSTGANV